MNPESQKQDKESGSCRVTLGDASGGVNSDPRARKASIPATASPGVTRHPGSRACADCGAGDRTVLIGMEPGLDHVQWWLCRACLYPAADLGPPRSSPHRDAADARKRRRDAQLVLDEKGRP